MYAPITGDCICVNKWHTCAFQNSSAFNFYTLPILGNATWCGSQQRCGVGLTCVQGVCQAGRACGTQQSGEYWHTACHGNYVPNTGFEYHVCNDGRIQSWTTCVVRLRGGRGKVCDRSITLTSTLTSYFRELDHNVAPSNMTANRCEKAVKADGRCGLFYSVLPSTGQTGSHRGTCTCVTKRSRCTLITTSTSDTGAASYTIRVGEYHRCVIENSLVDGHTCLDGTRCSNNTRSPSCGKAPLGSPCSVIGDNYWANRGIVSGMECVDGSSCFQNVAGGVNVCKRDCSHGGKHGSIKSDFVICQYGGNMIYLCDNGRWIVSRNSGRCYCPEHSWWNDDLKRCIRCPGHSFTSGEARSEAECACGASFISQPLERRKPGHTARLLCGCKAGERYVNITQRCERCPPRSFKAQFSLPDNNVTNTCISCPAYATSEEAATSESACRCTPSMIQNRTDKTCGCGAGTYYTGDLECLHCPVGTYKHGWTLPRVADINFTGQCESCSAYRLGSTTTELGSQYSTDCICPKAYFKKRCDIADGWCGTNSERTYCKPCMTDFVSALRHKNSDCEDNEVGTAAGYWRASSNSITIISCPMQKQCQQSFGEPNCTLGSTGMLCQTCTKGFTLISRICRRCKITRATLENSMILLCVTLVIAAVAFLSRHKVTEWLDERKDHKNDTAEQARLKKIDGRKSSVRSHQDVYVEWTAEDIHQSVSRKFKIVASFYQVVTTIPIYFQAFFPDNFSNTVAYFRIVNLNIEDLAPVDCYMQVSYYTKYLLKMAMVPIAIIVLYIARLIKPQHTTLIWKVGLMLLFTIYPSLCATCGETLRFLSDDDRPKSRRWLMADFRVDCDTPFHDRFMIIDQIFMGIYPFGIPMLFLGLMWPHREVLSTRIDEWRLPENLQYVNPLCGQYENITWYWEVVECIRKYLTVSVAIAVFQKYPSSQILTAAIICISYDVIFLYYAPYTDPIDDALAYFGHIVLTLIFLLACYTRLTTKLEEASQGALWVSSEVWLMDDLVDLAAVLTVIVLIAGTGTGTYDVYVLVTKGTGHLIESVYKKGDDVRFKAEDAVVLGTQMTKHYVTCYDYTLTRDTEKLESLDDLEEENLETQMFTFNDETEELIGKVTRIQENNEHKFFFEPRLQDDEMEITEDVMTAGKLQRLGKPWTTVNVVRFQDGNERMMISMDLLTRKITKDIERILDGDEGTPQITYATVEEPTTDNDGVTIELGEISSDVIFQPNMTETECTDHSSSEGTHVSFSEYSNDGGNELNINDQILDETQSVRQDATTTNAEQHTNHHRSSQVLAQQSATAESEDDTGITAPGRIDHEENSSDEAVGAHEEPLTAHTEKYPNIPDDGGSRSSATNGTSGSLVEQDSENVSDESSTKNTTEHRVSDGLETTQLHD